QTKVPGYRDRVVVVTHSPDEGGLNLNMPPKLIRRFAVRGRYAGEFLVKRFAETDPEKRTRGDEISWETHRWQRFRSVMPVIETLNAGLAWGWYWQPFPAKRSIDEMIEAAGGFGNPDIESPWVSPEQRDLVERL